MQFDIFATAESLGLTGIGEKPSINDSGVIAFVGKFDPAAARPESIFIADGSGLVTDISPSTTFRYAPAVQINNSNQVISRGSTNIVNSFANSFINSLFLWDGNAPGSLTRIASGIQGRTSPIFEFDAVFGFPAVNNAGEPVFSANIASDGNSDNFLVTPSDSGFNQVELGVPLRPMIADNGQVIVRSGSFGGGPAIETLSLYDRGLASKQDIATVGSGFSALGLSPGISDNGQVVAFYGNRASTPTDNPGAGIFISFLAGGTRTIQRVAGISSNGFLDPGETFTDTNNNGLFDSGEADIGLFTSFSAYTRVGVSTAFANGQTIAQLAYLGTDDQGAEGLASTNVVLNSGPLAVDSLAVDSQWLIRTGESISGLAGSIQDIDIYDPINASGQVAFWAQTSSGDEAVIRTRRAVISTSVDAVVISEGDSGTQLQQLEVTLSAASANTITVDYTTSDDTAIAGSDYIATSGTLTFAPGETIKTINVPVIGDTVAELQERYLITLSNPANATLDRARTQVFIIDNDGVPTVSISDAFVKVNAGANEEAVIAFEVTLSAASDRAISVKYSTVDGLANSSSSGDAQDYEAAQSQTLTFAPGETTKTIEIKVFGEDAVDHRAFEIFAKDTSYRDWPNPSSSALDPDQIAPSIYGDLGYRVSRFFQGSTSDYQGVGLVSDETFSIELSAPNNAVISDGIAKGTIYDLGKAPIIASRGTLNFADVLSDLSVVAVGFDQFQEISPIVKTWLNTVRNPENNDFFYRPHFIGHSLGGALTQLLAADYASGPNDIGEVITFNSPGINARMAFLFNPSKAEQVTHYVTSSDVVSLAGNRFLSGEYILSDFDSVLRPSLLAVYNGLRTAHLAPTIGSTVGYTETNVAVDGTMRPADLQTSPVRSSDALSNPFFTYLPDPDFFITQVAIASISSFSLIPGLPPLLQGALLTPAALADALTFRVTAETARRELGRVISDLQQLGNAALAPLQAARDAASRYSAAQWNQIIQQTRRSGNFIEASDIPIPIGSTGSTDLADGFQLAQGFLKTLAAAPDFIAQLNGVFGSDLNVAAAQSLAQAWLNDDFSNLAPIEIVAPTETNGGSGAFSLSRNVIYLSSDFVQSANAQQVAAVLLEEIGHYIDTQINEFDTLGDEGELFSAITRNISLTNAEIEAIRAQNDLVALPGFSAPSPWEAFAQWTPEIWAASVNWNIDTFTAAIQSVNTPPVLVIPIEDKSTAANANFTFQLIDSTFTEIDTEDSLTYTATLEDSSPLPSWLTFDPITQLFSGMPTISDQGTLNIRVIATDGQGSLADDIFTLTVSKDNTNAAPTAVNDSASTTVNTAININVLANDTDIDGNTLSLISVDEAANGSVEKNEDGTVEYTPDTGFSGTDSFTYTIDDGSGGTDTATVTVTINGGNVTPPVAENQTVFGNGSSEDFLLGNGTNVVYGNGGNDTFTAGSGNDILYGAGGNESFNSGTGEDVIYSNGGEDILFLNAGAGAVTFWGWGADDSISRGSGIAPSTVITSQIAGNDTQLFAGTDLLATLKFVNLSSTPAFV